MAIAAFLGMFSPSFLRTLQLRIHTKSPDTGQDSLEELNDFKLIDVSRTISVELHKLEVELVDLVFGENWIFLGHHFSLRSHA
eukprot:2286584-Rhodomonas_salina.1